MARKKGVTPSQRREASQACEKLTALAASCGVPSSTVRRAVRRAAGQQPAEQQCMHARPDPISLCPMQQNYDLWHAEQEVDLSEVQVFVTTREECI